MNLIFDSLISPDIRTYAVDLTAETLVCELENQINIAKAIGKNDAWIDKNIYFNVKNHEFRSPDTSEMPCVYIWFDRTDYGKNQTMSRLPSVNQLVVELFACGRNKSDDSGNVILSADAAADYRLEYLQTQVKQILMSEEAENLRCRAGLSSTIIKSVERTYYPEKDNIADSVISSKIIFEIEFDERTKYLSGREIKELYITNNIRDEFVSFLIKELN